MTGPMEDDRTGRARALALLRDAGEPWDLVVVGGGATGVGVALDAAARGWRTLLLERADFGEGTSSRSSKLVHGGVRYLREGNVGLVREALAERETLRRNAPHHVADLELVVPCVRWWERAFYGTGMWVYDRLAGATSFGRSRRLSRAETLARVPNLRAPSVRAGVAYHDGRFDDARLLVHLVATAAERGATLLNHVEVAALSGDVNGVRGVTARDAETGETFAVRARCVANAAGPFGDDVRRLDDPGAAPTLAPSRGAHVVLDAAFLGGASAVLVPRTEDRRVVFALPWRGRTLVGTTDTPVDDAADPRATRDDVDFLLRTIGRWLERVPGRSDVRSTFAGVRPLVRGGKRVRTAALARDHVVTVSDRGLITVAGGKWTTYRRMAEDVVDRAERETGRTHVPSPTREVRVHGFEEGADRPVRLAAYGSDAAEVAALEADPALARRIHPRLETTAAQVVFAVRREHARTVDDVLSRRTRDLVVDAAAAREAAPAVAALVARELDRDGAWERAQVERFTAIAAACGAPLPEQNGPSEHGDGVPAVRPRGG